MTSSMTLWFQRRKFCASTQTSATFTIRSGTYSVPLDISPIYMKKKTSKAEGRTQIVQQRQAPEKRTPGDVPLSLLEKKRIKIGSCAEKMEGVAGKEGQIPSEDFGRQLGQVLVTPGSGSPLCCSLPFRCFERLIFLLPYNWVLQAIWRVRIF